MAPTLPAPVFAQTLTHARVRAGQGDVRGARRILQAILERDPQDAEARQLLRELQERRQRSGREAPAAPLAPARAATPGELAARFRRALSSSGGGATRIRIRRLERWLRRIERRHDRGH